MLALGTNIASSNDRVEEENRTGWAFYLDNDLLTTGDRDQDYTGGAAVTLSGAAAATHPLSVDGWLTALNRFSRLERVYADRDYFQRHNFEFGFTLFTPRDIATAEPLPDDHPYASFFFVSNTQQTILPESTIVYQSSLTVGFLGLNIADDVQELIHSASGSEEPRGWDNQISSGGEPTARYGVSRQKTHFQREGRRGLRGEFKTSLEANVGFSTDAAVGLSWRWGRISTPWWSFNPHQAEYINLGAPVSAATASNGRQEFYFWAGASLRYRFYNAILQGQVRDSDVTFRRAELKPLIAEVWVGITKELSNGLSASLFVRGRTKEISGSRGRNPVWGGVIFSQAF
jgi:hypothetical protein